MKWPTYPKYKDSGVDWLGDVPEGWLTVPLWTLFRRTKKIDHVHEELLSVYRDYGVLPKNSRDDNFNKPSEDLTPYQLVIPGDLVINKMKAWQGSVAISKYRGIVSPAYFVFTANHNQNSVFLHYLFRSQDYIAAYMLISSGIRINQWDLDPQLHSRLLVLLPSSDEQEEISCFVIHECQKIDTLIAEQEKLITLLQEKRQAVISHAVTKGLNPDAPMKDSGVEWLGKVPVAWELMKLKRVWESYEYGISDSIPGDGQIKVVTMAHIAEGKVSTPEFGAISDVSQKLLLSDGDLLFNRTNSLEHIGKTGIYRNESSDIVTFASYLVRLTPNSFCFAEYLNYLLNSNEMRDIARQMAIPSINQANLTPSRYGVVEVAIPSVADQKLIIDYLDEQTEKSDRLIAEAENAIALLHERRTALISAAVTGKIDVRGLTASEPA